MNIGGNLLLVNKFLETDKYDVYGFGVLRDLLNRKGWRESGNFPRVTLCDFEVRVLGNMQRHTVQCVLVINIFTEKIFILLWMWFSILFVIALLDTLYWYSISLTNHDRLRFVLRHLELTGEHPEQFRRERMQEVHRFLQTFIKVDGVFVLRMVAAHAGVMFCTELTESLWTRFLSQYAVLLGAETSAGSLPAETVATSHRASLTSQVWQRLRQLPHRSQSAQRAPLIQRQPGGVAEPLEPAGPSAALVEQVHHEANV